MFADRKKRIMKKSISFYLLAVWHFAKRRWFALVIVLFAALLVFAVRRENSRPKTLRERVEAPINHFDGSHRELERYIKAGMIDPDSYEHVKTTYIMPADSNALTAIFTTVYRGKNFFGATVENAITARCDLESGRVIEVIPAPVSSPR